eukprot:CAMPEP_0119334550 /NCGR_PEP_ID=MMETSP1333-20130426/87551_1 /TAXON_ID=418940 /ORGANISM="Scyphosphaera apsteinii, Strain RCC1455" /LENGTH=328 /DNA_ID=CAMNT_0007344867 /DNA_START=396 /DNA_END=1382 /DNA_ORIENTATION=-
MAINGKEYITHASSAWYDLLYASYVNPKKRPVYDTLQSLAFGPRWNTHTNPNVFVVKLKSSTATIEIENVRLDGLSFQVVFYSGRFLATTLGSVAAKPDGSEWLSFEATLPPSAREGWMQMIIRVYLYGGREKVTLPRVKIDGVEMIEKTTEFSRDKMAFNHSLTQYQRPIHTALQWHVFPLLTCRWLLPAAWLRKIYLPVGNPETQWKYGAIIEGYSLRCEIKSQSLLDAHLVFCTILNRASIPTNPCNTIETLTHTFPPVLQDSHWVVRIVRKDGNTTDPSVQNLVHFDLVLESDDDKKSSASKMKDYGALKTADDDEESVIGHTI